MNRDPKRPVTLEDLLQLKRAERPAPEFWNTFERDLRAKQLAALVGKRPWWQSIPRVFAGFSRYHLPLGATAVVALTFFSIREYQSSPAKETPASSPPVAASVATPAIGSSGVTIAAAVPAAPIAVVAVKSAGAADAAAADESADAAAPMRVVPVVAMFTEAAAEEITPSARTIAVNRAMAQAVDPELANRYLNTARGFEARALPARSPAVEPLAQVSLSEARRARQFVAAMPVAFNQNPASSEKIARRISDERLYDSVSRFGASGDRVKFKF